MSTRNDRSPAFQQWGAVKDQLHMKDHRDHIRSELWFSASSDSWLRHGLGVLLSSASDLMRAESFCQVGLEESAGHPDSQGEVSF